MYLCFLLVKKKKKKKKEKQVSHRNPSHTRVPSHPFPSFTLVLLRF